MENFYKITIHFKNGNPISKIKRVMNNRRSEVEVSALEDAQQRYKNNIQKVDAWLLAETDPELVEYKKKWL